jgi:hypothetical protein
MMTTIKCDLLEQEIDMIEGLFGYVDMDEYPIPIHFSSVRSWLSTIINRANGLFDITVME